MVESKDEVLLVSNKILYLWQRVDIFDLQRSRAQFLNLSSSLC